MSAALATFNASVRIATRMATCIHHTFDFCAEFVGSTLSRHGSMCICKIVSWFGAGSFTFASCLLAFLILTLSTATASHARLLDGAVFVSLGSNGSGIDSNGLCSHALVLFTFVSCLLVLFSSMLSLTIDPHAHITAKVRHRRCQCACGCFNRRPFALTFICGWCVPATVQTSARGCRLVCATCVRTMQWGTSQRLIASRRAWVLCGFPRAATLTSWI